jgi:AbrB family looped-hinge helix DNA binding protein
MKVTVSSEGRIALPTQIREQDQIFPGQTFELERLEAGQYLLRRQSVKENIGVVDWLLSCPSTDWYRALRADSTDR